MEGRNPHTCTKPQRHPRTAEQVISPTTTLQALSCLQSTVHATSNQPPQLQALTHMTTNNYNAPELPTIELKHTLTCLTEVVARPTNSIKGWRPAKDAWPTSRWGCCHGPAEAVSSKLLEAHLVGVLVELPPPGNPVTDGDERGPVEGNVVGGLLWLEQ